MWIWIILTLIFSPQVHAANPYGLGQVEYFHQAKESQKSLDWQEAVITKEGEVEAYTPPIIVLNLLENPTDSNARAYLTWQRQKVDKIIKAQQAIEKVLQEEENL